MIMNMARYEQETIIGLSWFSDKPIYLRRIIIRETATKVCV